MSLSPLRIRNTGFTMIEMMIVISIIIALMGLTLFPYSYYMQRSNVEAGIDTLSQGWILAHKDIRNGKLFDVDKNANAVLIFRKGSTEVERYLLSGSTLPNLSNPTGSDIKKQNSIDLGSQIEIQGFSGITDATVGYFITAPYGTGGFFTGTTIFSTEGQYLQIGYREATLESGRARKVLLSPYLQ